LSSPALSAGELDSVRALYLWRLQERFSSLHLYGLDARRGDAQEGGQALDLLALYAPLNTTRRVPVDHEAGLETRPLASDARATRTLSLLEAAGQEHRAIVRGPHGSGKSTFLKFLALSLAERSPESEHAGLARLKPAWTHGWAFPVMVDMRDFAASPDNDGAADGLCAYIAADFGIYPDQLQRQLILPGGMLFLLDGIEMALEAAADFVDRFGRTANHLLLTSQEYVDLADERVSPLQSLTEITLSPWTTEQMDDFVRRWYDELKRKEWVDAETARDLPGQLRSSVRRDEIGGLARRPSLMTIIALLQTLRGRVPVDPVMFYHELIDLVITCWSEGRTGDERDLRQMFDMDALRTAVAQATYQAYARVERPTDLVELSESDLRVTLVKACRDGRLQAVRDLMTRILTRPGILDEHAPGVYTYPCISLQAYIAARYQAAQPELPQLIVHLAREDFYRWRQVILFTVARHARLQKDLPTALTLIDALCPHSLSDGQDEQLPDSEWRLAWLAGEAFLETAEGHPPTPMPGTQAPPQEPAQVPGTSQTLDRVQHSLIALLELGMLSPLERTQVGNVLDRLGHGDLRPGVSSPAPLWCEVQACPFWQGEAETRRTVEIDSFWIARYLVTNAQYAAFVSATGHPPPGHWQGNRPPIGFGNHPVVYITWEDAVRYCEWLAGHLRTARSEVWRSNQVQVSDYVSPSWTVRLPTSDEWEKAGRGGLLIPAPESGELVDNPLPHRVYPWGNSWRLSTGDVRGDDTRCNVSESNIGTTTPVGIYPDGASPYGLMDMAGNVWEWCLNWAGKEHRYKIRRGGAFRYTHDHARCAAYDKAYSSLAWPYLGFRVVLGPPLSGSLHHAEL